MITISKKGLLSVVLLAVVCGYFSCITAKVYPRVDGGGNDEGARPQKRTISRNAPPKTLVEKRFLGAGERETAMYSGIPEDFKRTCNNKIDHQESAAPKTLMGRRFLGAGERETAMYSGIPEDFKRTCNNKIDHQKSFYKPWAVMGYIGRLTNDTMGHVLVGHYTLGNETLYSLEFSHTLNPSNPFRYFLQPLISTLEVTGNFTYRNDPAGPIYEFNPYVTLRWTDFPWNRYVATTIGVGEGISYDSTPPEIETSTAANGQTQPLLNYLMLEVTFASPKNLQWEFVVRMHHRSGVYGLYNAENAGSTAVGIGIRYRF